MFTLNQELVVDQEDGTKLTAKIIGIDAYECHNHLNETVHWMSYTLVSEDSKNPKFERFWIVDHQNQDLGVNVWISYDQEINQNFDEVGEISGKIINTPVEGDTIASGEGQLKILRVSKNNMIAVEDFFDEGQIQQLRFKSYPYISN